jgi:PAS domain-containing protein
MDMNGFASSEFAAHSPPMCAACRSRLCDAHQDRRVQGEIHSALSGVALGLFFSDVAPPSPAGAAKKRAHGMDSSPRHRDTTATVGVLMGRRRAAAPAKIARGSLQDSQSSKLAEQRLQSVIELTADCYWEQDAEHRFTLYHPSGAPDPDLETLVGKTSWELSPEPPEGGWEQLRALLHERAPFRDVLHRVASATRGTRYVSFSGQPVFDERKTFRGYRGVARDVSAEIWGTALIQLENVVARVLTEADNVDDGLRRVLEAMCSSQQWTVGNFWRVDELRDALHHVVGWCAAQSEDASLLA